MLRPFALRHCHIDLAEVALPAASCNGGFRYSDDGIQLKET